MSINQRINTISVIINNINWKFPPVFFFIWCLVYDFLIERVNWTFGEYRIMDTAIGCNLNESNRIRVVRATPTWKKAPWFLEYFKLARGLTTEYLFLGICGYSTIAENYYWIARSNGASLKCARIRSNGTMSTYRRADGRTPHRNNCLILCDCHTSNDLFLLPRSNSKLVFMFSAYLMRPKNEIYRFEWKRIPSERGILIKSSLQHRFPLRLKPSIVCSSVFFAQRTRGRIHTQFVHQQ